jgi:hypothetical protein
VPERNPVEQTDVREPYVGLLVPKLVERCQLCRSFVLELGKPLFEPLGTGRRRDRPPASSCRTSRAWAAATRATALSPRDCAERLRRGIVSS